MLLYFQNLLLRQYRNIESLELKLHPQVNVFVGANAQGKTNLLESIYLLCKGRSFRVTDDSILSNVNSPGNQFLVSAQCRNEHVSLLVKVLYKEKKKKILYNEKPISPKRLNQQFPCVLFSPESLSIIKEGDKERRELLDDMIATTVVEKSVVIDDFKRALKQRNKLLKDWSTGVLKTTQEQRSYFSALTRQFLLLSSELSSIRWTLLRDLQPYFEESLQYIFEQPKLKSSVSYYVSGQKIIHGDPEQFYNAMFNRWQQLEQAEMSTGYSLIGAHKHDIAVFLDEKDSRYYCSQGQQRLLILALKMAQIELHYSIHNEYPVMLLDDVLSELDESKQKRLIEYLAGKRAQIFITTTSQQNLLQQLQILSGDPSVSTFVVENGQVQKAAQQWTAFSSEGGGHIV